MKMKDVYETDIVKDNEKLRDSLHDLIEKHYPHLRHSLRGEIELDSFLTEELIKVVEGFLDEV